MVNFSLAPKAKLTTRTSCSFGGAVVGIEAFSNYLVVSKRVASTFASAEIWCAVR